MTFKIKENYRFWFKLTLIYFLIQNIVRFAILVERPPGFIDFLDAVADGFLWDLGAWLILSIPIMLLSVLVSPKRHEKFQSYKFSHALIFLFSFVFSFIGFCELVFWNEFHSRFNFIAVDYLIYTNEVLRNIRESYPMGLILTLITLISVAITFGASRLKFKSYEYKFQLQKVITVTSLGVVFPIFFVMSFGPWLETHDQDFHDDQISRNGVLEFVRAFRSNKIDYQAFYPVLPQDEAYSIFTAQKVVSTPYAGQLKGDKPNVVMIVVESLGAKFIGPLSNNKDTTPYLNKLAHESIFFTNFYATGTRTVRGLEALNLSVPPTPGYAVVKRPDHKGLYSLGNTFASNGYDSTFMYGGNGFFDNMNSFFSGNGFQIIDQDHFQKNEITFSNAWGVCDEDLFAKATKTIEAKDPKKPFLLFLLTTSNHRPFTYPDGKIDIPSGESRAGAVKYTDFAIGKFLASAQKEKWAKNTIFIVVADHSTEGRGRFDLEMNDFHIPLWIYSPSLLKPFVVDKLGSQIDLLPTLIDLLGLKDNSPFFGHSLFNENWKEERAFIGNYQYVGLYKNKVLTTLGPNQMVRNYSFDPATKKQSAMKESPYLKEAISYYQNASHMLDKGLYKHP